MGHHRAVTIITRPPGYRGGVRPLRVLTFSTLGALALGFLLGLALAAGVAALVIRPPLPCPQIQISPGPDLSPDPLDSQWEPMPR